MSISSTTSRNDYIGAGTTAAYPYTFKVFRKQDLRVTKRNLSNVEFVLTVDIDFTVTGVGNPAGGSITLLAGNLPAGYKLTIRRVVELTQETDIRNQGDFFPETHEDQFDRHVMTAQQQQDEINRSVKNPESVPTTEFSPTLPPDIATPDRCLVTNPAGTGFILGLAGADADRIFNTATYNELKQLAYAEPTLQRWGWATDNQQLVFFCADVGVGDEGWLVVGG